MGGAARWFDEQFALLLFRPAGPFELLGEKRNGEERGGMASRLKATEFCPASDVVRTVRCRWLLVARSSGC